MTIRRRVVAILILCGSLVVMPSKRLRAECSTYEWAYQCNEAWYAEISDCDTWCQAYWGVPGTAFAGSCDVLEDGCAGTYHPGGCWCYTF